MGYLRPVQAVTRPHSFPIASGITFERGAFLWLNSDGAVTTVQSTNVPLGIADDDNLENITGKASKQQLLSATTTLAASGDPIAFTPGRTITSLATGGTTVPASWTLEYQVVGVWTAITLVGTTVTVTASTITLAASQAIFAIVSTAAKSYRLTATYTYKREQVGSEVVSDMFNNYSSMATDAVGRLCTVWFMDGIYETDQFDPLSTTAYTVGQKCYAVTGGLFTSSSANSSVQVGTILAAPAANYTAETKTVNGHQKPRPESLRLLFRAPFQA
jgi:hypothetical protein